MSFETHDHCGQGNFLTDLLPVCDEIASSEMTLPVRLGWLPKQLPFKQTPGSVYTWKVFV